MAVPEGGDMGKAQCFQHGGGFCYFVSHVFAAVAVGADGDAGAAQLPVMAQDVKVGQSHGGFMPKAGGIDFQAFAAANQFLQKLGHNVLKAEPGQMVAIVGPTGAGKTTLVNLLLRFYELNGGRILVDGVDITNMTRAALRKKFGMVLQDTWLFNGTIRDNIAYGRENATEEEIVAAAKAAHADHFIRVLPDGYDTILNEEVSNISQGQKQLLTIARALLADPEIMILDEATSSVDTRTELQIQTAMKTLMKGRTSFVIAHRLSTIREADVILVMKDGDVIETGNHESLMKQNGFYADLYNSQFNQEEEEA